MKEKDIKVGMKLRLVTGHMEKTDKCYTNYGWKVGDILKVIKYNVCDNYDLFNIRLNKKDYCIPRNMNGSMLTVRRLLWE